MNANELKRLRTESVLKELIPEALGGLEDAYLKGLCVTDVECKRGRYDAFVWLDKGPFDERERGHILAQLKKAAPLIQNHIMVAEGWFRAPNLHFKFDDRLEYQNAMDRLFEKVAKELKTGKKEG